MTALSSWQLWAVLSAVFAALTAIFAKIGIENINSDFATFIRTIVILITLGFILAATGQFQAPGSVSGRTYLFLVLSGLATGGSWICYFRALKIGQAAQVAPIDKLSVVLVAIFGVIFLGERLTAPNWLGVALIAAGAVLGAYRGTGSALRLQAVTRKLLRNVGLDRLGGGHVGVAAVAVALADLCEAAPIE
jgi:transporter family protein